LLRGPLEPACLPSKRPVFSPTTCQKTE